MKTALVTTTINLPRVLAHYRALDAHVRFFVAIDEKTPEEAGNFLAYDLPNTQISYLQHEWQCSPLLGYNTDSRRNIALLESLRWGADLIVSIDDDMLISGNSFFTEIEQLFSYPYSGLQLGAPKQWFDAGQFTIPPARQRGLPAHCELHNDAGFVHDVRIGAAQGIILGVPDTDAATTIVDKPFVKSATDVLRNGFVVHPKAFAVFNSQITIFRRELAPAFFQFYKTQQRNTDIIASVIMRRLMRDRNLYTYYGPPSGFHARTWRDPFKDMRAEQHGIEIIDALADYLDNTDVIKPGQSVVQNLRAIYVDAPKFFFSEEHRECARAWLDDCEAAL